MHLEGDVVLGGVSGVGMVFGKNAVLDVLLEVVFGLTLPQGLGTYLVLCVLGMGLAALLEGLFFDLLSDISMASCTHWRSVLT